MENSNIREIIEKYCEIKDDRKYIKCANAFKAAEELNIGVAEVGKFCHGKNIKIMGCQLGCFK
ncbi:hypothetical protein [Acetobacterium bakii]|uniref:Uncharacterized protein n=1 Tax=Acetobacterium bakii TaxID=52689 RepID=A0A0L6U6G5_9FIRM|nr:hypothetical protein [Acetobacterium bakii]KNZ43365.1 hypothetical protein AKG39_01295 [Acetobacterium bakii]